MLKEEEQDEGTCCDLSLSHSSWTNQDDLIHWICHSTRRQQVREAELNRLWSRGWGENGGWRGLGQRRTVRKGSVQDQSQSGLAEGAVDLRRRRRDCVRWQSESGCRWT
jgi:hypothetical protein